MDFVKSMAIAASGLRAQAGRMRVISENIANSDSTAQTAGGDPYRRRIPTFTSQLDRTLDARGRDVANATVVVFATDRTFWGEPSRWGETSRFVASVRAGRDGTFSVRNLAPGDYWAAALTQV